MGKIIDTAPTTSEKAQERAKELGKQGVVGAVVSHLPDGSATVEIHDGK